MDFKAATDQELQVVLQDLKATPWDIIAVEEEIKRRKPHKWGRVQIKIKEVPRRA
ncbi:hypothetical protein ACE6ED_13230 [Paenibacillus sp. CN-4]|uniref:hypothetical protein n=1 Tax=Paenibacillus nanchangensis TaxID=3348343 RepID=UPI00397C91EB